MSISSSAAVLDGPGNDTIILDNETIKGNVDGGGGNDSVAAIESAITGSVFGGTGADLVVIFGSQVGGNVEGNDGNDTIATIVSNITGSVLGGTGADLVGVFGSQVRGNVEGSDGNDTIFVSSDGICDNGCDPIYSTILGNVLGGSGDDNVTIEAHSTISGQVAGGTGNDTVALVDATVGSVSGDDGKDDIAIILSTVDGSVLGGSQDDKIRVLGSDVGDNVEGNDGADGIVIGRAFDGEGFVTSNIDGSVLGGSGGDAITVHEGTTIGGSINGEDGSDTILVQDARIAGTVTGGLGNDVVTLNAGSNIAGEVSGAEGNDQIFIGLNVIGGKPGDGLIINGSVSGGAGNDAIRIDAGFIAKGLDPGEGDDNVILAGGRIGGSSLDMGAGNDVLVVDDALDPGQTLDISTIRNFNGGSGSDRAAISNLASAGAIQFDSWTSVELTGTVAVSSLNLIDSTLQQTNGALTISAPTIDAILQRPGAIVALASNGAAMLSLDGTSRISMQDQAADDSITISQFHGDNGSQLLVDVNASTGTADQLHIDGATGRTGIQVALVAPQGTIIAKPITIVDLPDPATQADAFFLLNGPINNGLTQISLLLDPATGDFVAVSTLGDTSNGLANPVSAPSILNRISAELGDRALERSEDILSSEEKGHGERLPGATQVSPGSWSKIVGSAVEQDTKVSTNIAGTPFTQLDSYSLGLFGLISGLDIAKAGVTSDGTRYAMLAGVLGGYLTADVDFDVSPSSQSIEAGLAGAYTGLSYGGWRAHLLGKVDFGSLKFVEPDLNARDSIGFQTYSVEFNGAYNFDLGDSIYIQPIGSVYYAHTDIDDAFLAGTTIDFKSQDSLRLRAGVRLGQDKRGETHVFKPWVQASIWQEVGDVDARLVLTSGGAPLDLISAGVETYGELGLGLNAVHIGPGLSGQVRGDLKFGDLNFLGAAAQLGIEYRWPVK